MATLSDASLRDFPFQTVPLTEPTSTWVGRPDFQKEVRQLVESWNYRTDSSIYLLWADFGAGKTHALRYIQYLASLAIPPSLAVYTDLPKVADDFKGVYDQIIPQIPEKAIRDAILEFRAKEGSEWLSSPLLRGDRDSPRVLWVLANMPEHHTADVARKWLRGERCNAGELRLLDGVSALTTSDQATRTLSTICRLIAQFTEYNRVIVMLDEFQRIGQAAARKIAAVNTGIHTWFNSCPTGLSIMLVYSIGVPETIKHLVTEEVQSRIAKTFSLPGLSNMDAEEFVAGIIGLHSTTGNADSVFTPKARHRIIKDLTNDGKLTPRA